MGVQWSGLPRFALQTLLLLGELGSSCHNRTGLRHLPPPPCPAPWTHPCTSPQCVCVCVCVSVCAGVCSVVCLQAAVAAVLTLQPCPLRGPRVGRRAMGTWPPASLLLPQVNLSPLGLLARACESPLDHTHRAGVCLPLRLVSTLRPCRGPVARVPGAWP